METSNAIAKYIKAHETVKLQNVLNVIVMKCILNEKNTVEKWDEIKNVTKKGRKLSQQKRNNKNDALEIKEHNAYTKTNSQKSDIARKLRTH